MSLSLSSLIAIFLSLLLAACGPTPPAPSKPLTVAAAADLGPLTDELSALYRAESGHEIRFVLGSSGLLARQIEQGAPYDLYLSANAGYVEALGKAGKIDADSVRVYAFGRLGLWSKDGLVTKPADLLRPEIRRFAMPNPEHAPYGEAARDFLQRAGVWDPLAPKVVYGENVRQAAQFASTGNAEAVISAWTLIQPMGGQLLPKEQHSPIRQAGGVVAASTRPQDARRFLDFLAQPKTLALFARYGFDPPPASNR
jgi:molybdate transport system substrate-binding protein